MKKTWFYTMVCSCKALFIGVEGYWHRSVPRPTKVGMPASFRLSNLLEIDFKSNQTYIIGFM